MLVYFQESLHPSYYSHPALLPHPREAGLTGQPMIPATLLAGYQVRTNRVVNVIDRFILSFV